jgi:capsular exopolysaccharide synthesis family protein
MLLAGPVPPNPSELLDSGVMRDLLEEAQSRYDLIVIDTPPLSLVPDAIPLIHQVSAVVAVIRLNKTTRDEAHLLRSQLDQLEAPLVGFVVNDVTSRDERYAYGYGYAYRYRAPAAESR